MALEEFRFQTLATMDEGRLAAAFEQAFDRLRRDCEDRPGLKKARTLTMTVELVPTLDTDVSKLARVHIAVDFKEKVPARQSKAYEMLPARGGLLFNDLSHEDARQGTLDEVGPRGLEKEKKEAVHAG